MRICRHLTYANVMATIAVFLVLGGGTAVALNGSNTVQSDDLAPGAQVTAAHLAANPLNASGAVDNSPTAPDIPPTAPPQRGAPTGPCDPPSTRFLDLGRAA